MKGLTRLLGPLDENDLEGDDLDDKAEDDNAEIGVKFCRDWGKEGDQRLGKMVLL
jgi:hypothetical protein